MKKITFILFLCVSCTLPNDVEQEKVIQDGHIKIEKEKTNRCIGVEKEKTKQLQYQWKIDSLKAVRADKH